MKSKKKVKVIVRIIRSGKKKVSLTLFSLSMLLFANLAALADWSVVTYIQADNNLDSFAYHNINAMKKVPTSDKVNVLVQWDQPHNNKTWRYKIEKGKKVEAGSLSSEMGMNPEKELVDMMQWVKDKYPAKHYMMVLWNHGNGVIDRKIGKWKSVNSWMEIPGAPKPTRKNKRGILYDDSQGTYLSNQGLTRALKKINTNVLGKKIDIVGMDACLMAMVEVAYQMKDDAQFFVGAQHTEPGDGWAYDKFLKPLVEAPALFGAKELSQSIVLGYKDYYSWDRECTQSAIDLSKIGAVKEGVDSVLRKLNDLKRFRNTSRTQSIVDYARSRVTRFYTAAYADLHCFYRCLRKKSKFVRKTRVRKKTRYQKALRTFEKTLTKEMKTLQSAVIASATGGSFRRAKGLSIYLPSWKVNSTYLETDFAKESGWLSFIS